MAGLQAILAVNNLLHERFESTTAIFTGATKGVGLGTLRAFAKHVPKPTAIIAGRNRVHFEAELENLKSINANGEFIFIETDMSLINTVDATCTKIKDQISGKSIDLLFMSQGYRPSLTSRTYTSEGLDEFLTVLYYGRVRLAENLINMGLMKRDARIVSILGGCREGRVFEDDLSLVRNWGIFSLRGHITSVMTLTFDKMAEQYPDIGFLHVFPGRVDTGAWSRSANGWLLWIFMRYVLEPIMFLGGISLDESGERMLWMATNAKFGKGSWSLDYDGAKSQSKWLAQYRENAAVAERISEFNQQVFDKAKKT